MKEINFKQLDREVKEISAFLKGGTDVEASSISARQKKRRRNRWQTR